MPSSRAVFVFNNRKAGVNRHLRFCPFPKKTRIFMYLEWVRIIHLTMTPTRHISELKYARTHGTFPNILETDKTAGDHSLQIYDYLSQIQRETKSFLLIVRHNTEWPPISDWQWRHRRLFFFVGSQNRVNLVLFFKPCTEQYVSFVVLTIILMIRVCWYFVANFESCGWMIVN